MYRGTLFRQSCMAPWYSTALVRLCMHYQLEYLEHLGAERIFACSKMHPDKMKERFPNDPILDKVTRPGP